MDSPRYEHPLHDAAFRSLMTETGTTHDGESRGIWGSVISLEESLNKRDKACFLEAMRHAEVEESVERGDRIYCCLLNDCRGILNLEGMGTC